MHVLCTSQHSQEEFTEAVMSDHRRECGCGQSSQSLSLYIKMIDQLGGMLSWWWGSYLREATARSLIFHHDDDDDVCMCVPGRPHGESSTVCSQQYWWSPPSKKERRLLLPLGFSCTLAHAQTHTNRHADFLSQGSPWAAQIGFGWLRSQHRQIS